MNVVIASQFSFGGAHHETQEKRRISTYVNAQLTSESVGGFHAQEVFEMGLGSAGFEVLARDVSEWNGKRVRGVEAKESPDLDFVVRKDGIEYGVDVT